MDTTEEESSTGMGAPTVSEEDEKNASPLTRADLDHVIDRFESIARTIITEIRNVPEVAEEVAEDPESVVELPTAEREEPHMDKVTKKMRYI
jgi:hypothetical protein